MNILVQSGLNSEHFAQTGLLRTGAQRCGMGDGDGLGAVVAAGDGAFAGLGVGVGVGVMSDKGMVEGVSVEGVGVGDGLGLCCTVTGDWARNIRQKSSVAARHRNIG